jgi:hypothetical protein
MFCGREVVLELLDGGAFDVTSDLGSSEVHQWFDVHIVGGDEQLI